MLAPLLQSSAPSGFEISSTLLIVFSLLIPAVVFFVGVYRDEDTVEGPLGRLTDKSADSLGTALGLQAIVALIVGLLINVYYILFSNLFSGLLPVSIEIVGGISLVAIVTVSVILFLMIWGLSSSNRQQPGSEVNRLRDDVDKTILEQEKDELRYELNRRKATISDLTTDLKRLEIAIKNSNGVSESEVEKILNHDNGDTQSIVENGSTGSEDKEIKE